MFHRAGPGGVKSRYRAAAQYCRKLLEFFNKQTAVLADVIPEQGEPLGKPSTTQHHLHSPTADGCQTRKPLKEADRVVGAKNSRRSTNTNAARTTGNCREDYFRRRGGKIGPVVLANAKKVHARLVCKNAFVNHIAEHLRVRVRLTVTPPCDITKGMEPEFDAFCHPSLPYERGRGAPLLYEP